MPSTIRTSTSLDEDRRLRDEARMREIYGYTPEPESTTTEHHHHHHHQPHPDSYIPQRPSPPSPSEEAYERRETRRRGEIHQTDSLPELLLRSLRVLMRDRKNVVIVTLGFLVLLMALRAAPPAPGHPNGFDASLLMEQRDVLREMPLAPIQQQQVPPLEQVVNYQESDKVASSSEPCVTSIDARQTQASAPAEVREEVETMTEKKVVRIVQTVTETETFKVKVTSTDTEIVKPTEEPVVQQAPQADGEVPDVEVVVD
jgi:hypothetical protein